MVGEDQRSRAGHVLNDDVRLTGYMTIYICGDEARESIVAASGRRADIQADLLPLEIGSRFLAERGQRRPSEPHKHRQ
jgi:hypothetical protein